MLRTLSTRLALTLFLFLCLIVGTYGVLAFRGTQLHLEEANQKLNRDLARYLITANKLERGDPVNHRALATLFARLMSVNPNIEIYLLDADGTILSYSAANERVKRKSISVEPVQRFIGQAVVFPLLGDDPRDLSRKKVFSAAPLPLTGPTEAYLYVILGGEEYDSVASMWRSSRLMRLNLEMAAVLVLFLIATWWLLFWWITRRLRRLNLQVEEFRRGPHGMPASAAAASGDEIDQLQLAFVQMSTRIAQQVDDLQQNDGRRRELIANVSHDLRTPLTILHGYLETLLIKGASMSDAERHGHVETAARHSERLGKLVQELFELAKLESQGISLQLESFSLADLVQDTAQEFRQLADQKGARIETTLNGDGETVRGDIAMIERVVENLLQNAINHTSPGGKVVVTFGRQDNHMVVSVVDTGSGIPNEDLPHVFHRFYRARNTSADNAQGAGLGLAISKRIIELHGGEIRVESVIDVGTTLTFKLPVAETPS